ncbi:hypothetical protein NHH03_05555 [Stieleria sp. TO1_6]|uniref:tetratricopeptide repeat protein n=1 Tax=Stieleria tagensis TaxID=2956795 RepID=UPI00209AF6D7|nr:hypothetical protein [Stieleria tagensis]MCO8121195.1 hypothetical protein [Stieleria tagensis]
MPRRCVAAGQTAGQSGRCWGGLVVLITTLALVGCRNDSKLAQQIQSRRQAKQQSQSHQDHLAETFALLRQFIELEPKRAQRQIAYHLNRWSDTKPPSKATVPELVKTIRDILPERQLESRIGSLTFQPSDSNHLRDSYLYQQLYNWVDTPQHDDALLAEWLKQQSKELGQIPADQLRTATRLFDWTVRNIALELDQQQMPAPPGPELPFGMTFRGAGYRQTNNQCLMRGTGDGLQRADVFIQLCLQAEIPAAMIATIDGTSGELTPFCVGVLIADEIYLFEPRLGIFVPGPDQVGIATLGQARSDAVILRRLGIAGLDQFTYPIRKEDVQQCVALLALLPETISPRMQQLQSGLTGERRMNVYVDADQMAEQFDAVTGISSVRLWQVPLLSEIYKVACDQHAQRDPVFAFWYFARWAMLDADYEMAKKLSQGRWQHLVGQFSDSEDESQPGARKLYLEQRSPEFEIEDLRIDVDLQAAYGIRRRDLGVDGQQFEQQIAQIQTMMRLGKRTATYWLSLLQADDGRLETAEGWLQKRVLDEDQQSYWIPAARYNLGRVVEALGKTDQAIEIYKREDEPQEHGNRIRARLLENQTAP